MATPAYRYPNAQGPTWKDACAMGQLVGARSLTILGRMVNAKAPTGSERDLRFSSDTWIPLTSPERMSIVSGAVNDNPTGDGARIIQLKGLDINYNEIQETVVLDGQTPVLTLNTYLRINEARVVDWGAEGRNIGDIIVTAEISLTEQTRIVELKNKATQAIYTVPNNKGLLLTGASISIGKGDEALLEFAVSPFGVDGFYTETSVYAYESMNNLGDLNIYIPSKSDVKIIVTALTVDPRISVSLYCIEIHA